MQLTAKGAKISKRKQWVLKALRGNPTPIRIGVGFDLTERLSQL